jgi:meiotic recombination protein SPO11
MPPKSKRARKNISTDINSKNNDKSSANTSQDEFPSRLGRKRVTLADDADIVLSKCRLLRKELKLKLMEKEKINKDDDNDEEEDDDININSLDNGGKSDSSSSSVATAAMIKQEQNQQHTTIKSLRNKAIVEVTEMSPTNVIHNIESIAIKIVKQILDKKGFTLDVPSRTSSNQIYVPELDRIVLGEKKGLRHFLNVKEARKSAITTRVLQLLHSVLLKNIHITKRDLFYTDVKLFVDQSDSDGVLDDIATMVGCTRSNLHVVASDKGLVVGRISFVEDGDFIDCTRMGVGGKAIPPYIDKITDISSDADFVLLVEKEAAYMRMAEDRFYNKYPCIVITAKGQPDVATRMFLSRLTAELQIPVLGLVDSDPYGLKILSVYMSGSKNMSYDSASLTTPNIKWLGLRPSDLDKYNLPEQCRLDMTDNDIKTGKELLKEDFIKKNKRWMKELEIMVRYCRIKHVILNPLAFSCCIPSLSFFR